VFGWQMVVSQVTWYLYTNADFAIVGRVLGKAPLGAYTIGWSMASIPVDRISAVVGRVTPAVLAAVQTDQPALRRYFAGLTEALAAITFPASIGLALVADQFVLVALGDGWVAAILPLRLLALYAGFRSIATLYGQVLVATGRGRLLMQFNLLALLILPALFYLGTGWGTAGVAAGWIVGYPIVAVGFFLRYVLRFTGMSAAAYLRALWPATSGTAVMAAAVLGLRQLTDGLLAAPTALALNAAAGILVYVGYGLLVHRDRLEVIRRTIRGSRPA
jgi:PST family polysaccharide transporter